MLQTKKSRINRTIITFTIMILSVSILKLIVFSYTQNVQLLIFGICGLVLAIGIFAIILRLWTLKHGLSHGCKYALLHAKMTKRLNQALYDCGIYLERVVLLKKCAALPKIDISIDDSLFKGVVRIENCIKYDKRLDELPISSALPDEYIITTSYISDDCNDYVYEFELYHIEQLVFNSYADFQAYCDRIDEYKIFLDARYVIPVFHMLVIGQTGSGKSYCLYNLILQMLSKPRPYELYIADPKLSGLYVLGMQIAKDRTASSAEEIINLLQAFYMRMIERKKELCKKLHNKLDSDYRDFNLSPICLIIDEYSSFRASLMRFEKKTRDMVDEIIGSLVREGRQLGCFCIIAQQQTNANNLSTELKENIPFKIILGMTERQTYITALGGYPDIARRHFDKGQGLMVYPQIATAENPAITSIATMNFDILKACDEILSKNKH